MFLNYLGRISSSINGTAAKRLLCLKSSRFKKERTILHCPFSMDSDHKCTQSKHYLDLYHNYNTSCTRGALYIDSHRKYSTFSNTRKKIFTPTSHCIYRLPRTFTHRFQDNIIEALRVFSTMHKHDVGLAELLGAHVDKLNAEYDELNKVLLESSNDDAEVATTQVSKRLAELGPVMCTVADYNASLQEKQDLENILKNEMDKELIVMVKEELQENQARTVELQDKLLRQLVPRLEGDEVDDLILEVSAGVGGQEAMLFTEEMFRLYEAYAYNEGWMFQSIGQSSSDIGGTKKAAASISGTGVYRKLKYEAGVHRVQRVPRTEKAGRVHTSTMTVAILPRPKQIEVVLRPQDIHFEAFRASGAGGQHVNTTSSAVRVKHIPTGVVVERSTDRSQIINRRRAMEELASRIYSAQLDREMAARKSQRKLQVGTAGRSEKVRTYNFSQDRVTDHRIGLSMFDLSDFMNGGRGLGEMIEALLKFEWEESVTEFLQKEIVKET